VGAGVFSERLLTAVSILLAAVLATCRLLTDAEDRIGFQDIIKHPFFKGIDWKNLRGQPAPWRPEVVTATDTKYFDELEEFEEPDWFNTYDAKDPSTGMWAQQVSATNP
jgi:hypothetical protein